MILIQIALIILKALGYINWSWYLVLAPVIITFLRGMVEGFHEEYKKMNKRY